MVNTAQNSLETVKKADNRQFLALVRAYFEAKLEHQKADDLNKTLSDDTSYVLRTLVKPTVGRYCSQRCEKYKQKLDEKKQAIEQLLKDKPALIAAITSKRCCTAFHYAVEKQDANLLSLLLSALDNEKKILPCRIARLFIKASIH